jgi:hypothetical protein
MRLGKLNSRLRLRVKRRDRQVKRWKATHDRGHAHAARREAKAARYLKLLISREERRRRRRAPKVMFDDTSVELIPKDAPAVAGYVGGLYRTWPSVVAGWPRAHKLSIAVNSSQDARCLDIEVGDATPADAPAWVRRQQKRNPHEVPVLYGSISVMPEIVAHMDAAGFHRREYLLWSAHYTFHAHICGPRSCGYPTKCDATQWTSQALGRSLDESRLSSEFFRSHW